MNLKIRMKRKDVTSKALKNAILEIDPKSIDMDLLRKFDLNHKFGPAYGLFDNLILHKHVFCLEVELIS